MGVKGVHPPGEGALHLTGFNLSSACWECFIWSLLYSKYQVSKESVVKESSLWRLLFFITYQQIRSYFWVGREAVWSVLCRGIGPKGKPEGRLDLRPCPSCRERKRVRNRVTQSKPCELYAFHLHCQWFLSSSLGASHPSPCSGAADPGAASVQGAEGLSSTVPSFSTCHNDS